MVRITGSSSGTVWSYTFETPGVTGPDPYYTRVPNSDILGPIPTDRTWEYEWTLVKECLKNPEWTRSRKTLEELLRYLPEWCWEWPYDCLDEEGRVVPCYPEPPEPPDPPYEPIDPDIDDDFTVIFRRDWGVLRVDRSIMIPVEDWGTLSTHRWHPLDLVLELHDIYIDLHEPFRWKFDDAFKFEFHGIAWKWEEPFELEEHGIVLEYEEFTIDIDEYKVLIEDIPAFDFKAKDIEHEIRTNDFGFEVKEGDE
jgi:hypothetical protein